jgi:ABC-type spermidine/putrescine transport system permease subunit II
MKLALVAAISTAVLLVPQLAAACAVCFTGRADETRIAFLVTTGLLSALPILLIGSLVWWLRRRARQIRDEHVRASGAGGR